MYTQLTALWSGFTGAPGYTRMCFDGAFTSSQAGARLANMATFFNAIKAYLPASVAISFSTTAQIFNTPDGELIDEVVASPQPTAVAGSSTSAYSGATGMVVNWITGQFNGGRRVRGRTFLVPATDCFYTDGTLQSNAITTVQNAANALVSGTPSMVVRSKITGSTSIITPVVQGATVPDRAAVLRSRRD
jgi:hypothetical protein